MATTTAFPDQTCETINAKAILLSFGAICLLMLAAIAAPTGQFILVIAKPGQPPSALHRMISDAGGQFVEATRFDWMAIATSDTGGFAGRLMDAGALIVVDHALAAGCSERTRT